MQGILQNKIVLYKSPAIKNATVLQPFKCQSGYQLKIVNTQTQYQCNGSWAWHKRYLTITDEILSQKSDGLYGG